MYNNNIFNMQYDKKILLWGGRSYARIINEMIQEYKVGKVKIIFDQTVEKLSFSTDAYFVNNIVKLSESISDITHFIICIGAEHGFARLNTGYNLENLGLITLSLIHEKSFIDQTSSLGRGCQVMPFAVVNKFTKIGNYSIINTNATIDHECVIGNGVHIMGNAAIAGKVEIGDFATIGTNSTILPYLTIGEGSFVGAGAVVTKDVQPYSVVIGVPAKKIRDNKFY